MSRLSSEVVPERYFLDLQVDPNKNRFSGCVEIRLRAPENTRQLELHAVDLDISETAVRDELGEIPVVSLTANAKRESIHLRLKRATRSTELVLRLAYSGPLRSDLRGLYLARSGSKRLASTQLEATDARRMFPCFDEPNKKARFTLQVTTPKRNQLVSNAPIASERVSGRDKTVLFRETPPLSTYLIALVVGELEHSRARRHGSTPIRVWSVPGKSQLTGFALETAAASLERLERYFGLPYPYEKLDLIAVPDFEFGAMENAGAVTFRESLLLVDPKTISLAEKKRVAEVIAHELAHMWFGDLVTMEWWDDLWLNEAFATWMAFDVVDDWKPEWNMWLDFQHHRAAAFSLDSLANTHPVYVEVDSPEEATENFDAITYEKGASVVRMLERWLGRAAFRRGVRRYIRNHAEGNAVAADLWRALEAASGKPVEAVAREWIVSPGYPLLHVALGRSGKTPVLALRQERCSANPKLQPEGRWPIPVVLRLQPERGRAKRHELLLEKERERVKLEFTPRLLYANADEGGFYRPLHDEPLLDGILERLGRLNDDERMGLVGHQWAGFRADRAPLEHFLQLVDVLGDESRPEVLEAASGPLSWLTDQAVPRLKDRDAAAFRDWLRSRFEPTFLELGWRARRAEDDATRVRRQALLRISAGLAEAPDVLAEVEVQIARYLKDAKSVEANLVGPLVELAARSGDNQRYEAYRRALKRARTPQERNRFEAGLASFRDPALIERTLEMVLGDEIPTQNVVPLLGRVLQNPQGRDACWAFIQKRWSVLSPRISTGLASRLIQSLPALQTAERRREVQAFFRANPLPSARRTLKQALEQFLIHAALRRRAAPELRSWLRDRLSP